MSVRLHRELLGKDEGEVSYSRYGAKSGERVSVCLIRWLFP
jgi:hypothetical protein